jgi:hypothetical protein
VHFGTDKIPSRTETFSLAAAQRTDLGGHGGRASTHAIPTTR